MNLVSINSTKGHEEEEMMNLLNAASKLTTGVVRDEPRKVVSSVGGDIAAVAELDEDVPMTFPQRVSLNRDAEWVRLNGMIEFLTQSCYVL